jgi:hypothetical protein
MLTSSPCVNFGVKVNAFVTAFKEYTLEDKLASLARCGWIGSEQPFGHLNCFFGNFNFFLYFHNNNGKKSIISKDCILESFEIILTRCNEGW